MFIFYLTIPSCVTKPQPNHIGSWWLISNSDSMKKVIIHYIFSIFYLFELFDQTRTNMTHFIYLQDCPWHHHSSCYVLTSTTKISGLNEYIGRNFSCIPYLRHYQMVLCYSQVDHCVRSLGSKPGYSHCCQQKQCKAEWSLHQNH